MEHCHVTLTDGKDYEAPLMRDWRDGLETAAQQYEHIVANVEEWWDIKIPRGQIKSVRVAS